MSTALTLALDLLRTRMPAAVEIQAPQEAIGLALRVPVRAAAAFLVAGIGCVVAAGTAVATLSIGLGRDHVMGLVDLFDLNGERNFPTWWSSTILLVSAALLFTAAAGSTGTVRRRWGMLGGVFLLLSLDETASLHEMSNAPLRLLLSSGPALYFPWIFLGLTFVAAVGLSQRRLLLQLPPSTRWTFIAAGAVYVLGAAGIEALAAPVYATTGKQTALHASLVILEETLEMAGVALFLVALLRHLMKADRPVRISFDDGAPLQPERCRLSPRRVAGYGFILVAALVATSLSVQALHYLTAADVPNAVRLVNLSREGNIPTWYQAAALLACASAAGAIAAAAFRAGGHLAANWTLLALLFVYLSADEASAIHELSVKPLRSALGATGILYYPWVLVGALAVLLGAAGSRNFLAQLPRPTRRACILGAAVFVGGALGVEALSGLYAEAHGRDNLGYGLITTVEEGLEMIGVLIVLRGLLAHLRDHVGEIAIGGR